MTDYDKINEITNLLFDCKFDDPNFDHEDYYHYDIATSLVSEFGWNNVFPVWFTYLQEKCITVENVINFANLFFYYDGAYMPINNPYPFISYFYYKVDTSIYSSEVIDIFDSITIPLLSNIGAINIDANPNYIPENDERILQEVEKWKNKQ